jgi:hypothetical protein
MGQPALAAGGDFGSIANSVTAANAEKAAAPAILPGVRSIGLGLGAVTCRYGDIAPDGTRRGLHQRLLEQHRRQ